MTDDSTMHRNVRRLFAGVLASVLIGIGAVPIAGLVASAATLATWSSAGSTSAARFDATATALANGNVLFVGGNSGTVATPVASNAADLYNPSTGTWSTTGGSGMTTARYDATASLLQDGNVLISGGVTGSGGTATAATTAEIYNTAAGGFSLTTAPPQAVFGASAVVLQNGNVLMIGGDTGSPTSPTPSNLVYSYNVSSQTWTQEASMTNAAAFASATLLSDGTVLVAGGNSSSAAAERYNPTTNTWSAAGSLATNRYDATATALSNGSVLVAGGFNEGGSPTALQSAELYSASANTWSAAGTMVSARANATATLLSNGMVLLAGGNSATPSAPSPLQSAEMYNPSANTFSATGSLATARSDASAAVLPGGYVLVVGGLGSGGALASAESYYAGTVPVFTSAAAATFAIGFNSTFTITTSASPTATVSESGTLPAGLTFTAGSNGTATISGRPIGAPADATIALTATNGIGSGGTQSLVLAVAKSPVTGYLLGAASGTSYVYGNQTAGGTVSVPKARSVVSVAPARGGTGYYVVTKAGNVYNEAGAAFYGSKAGKKLPSQIVAFATTSDAKGYWLVARSGTVYAFGDAHSYSSLSVNTSQRPVVAFAPTPDNLGYWIVTSKGNIYNYGDAHFYGSKASAKLPHPVVAFAPSLDAKGYFLVTSGGNIYNLGDAKFLGSKASVKLPHPVVAFAPTSDGTGYYLVTSGGNVFNYGDAKFFGSTASKRLPSPIVGFFIKG